MVQRVAITDIRQLVTPGVAGTKDTPLGTRPKYKTIKAGTLLELSGSELVDMENAGAVVAKEDGRASKWGYGPTVAKGYMPKAPVGRDEVVDEKPARWAAPAGLTAPKSGVDVEMFSSHAAIDAYVETNGFVKPDGWTVMKLPEKKDWLKDALSNRSESPLI